MKNTQNTAHTPGPWKTAGRAVYSADNWNDGRNLGAVYVAQCFAEPDKDDPLSADFLGSVKLTSNDNEAEANAALIAAAPELLENLQTVTDVLSALEECGYAYPETIAKARAAMTKAKGLK